MYPPTLIKWLVVNRSILFEWLYSETEFMRTELRSEQRLRLDGRQVSTGEQNTEALKAWPTETFQLTMFLTQGEGSHPQLSSWLWTRHFCVCYNRSCVYRGHQGSLLDGPLEEGLWGSH